MERHAGRYVKYNQRVMMTYAENRRAKEAAIMKELEAAAAEGRQPNLPGMAMIAPQEENQTANTEQQLSTPS